MVIKLELKMAKQIVKEIEKSTKLKCKLTGLKTEPCVEVYTKDETVFYSIELKRMQAIADVYEVMLFVHLTYDIKKNKAVISAIFH